MTNEFVDDIRVLERAGQFSIEYEASRDGWTGREPDYAPYTVVVATREREGGEFLPEDEWLRFAGFDIEGAVRFAAQEVVVNSERPEEECQVCEGKCLVDYPNDVAEHFRFDTVIARRSFDA